MFNPVVCFEKQALAAEATNPLTSLWRSLTCALTAFHSYYLIDFHPINTPFCCIFKAKAASLIQTSTVEKKHFFFVSLCESLQMFYSGSFPWNCPTCESFYPRAPLCILVMALFFLQSSPIINCIDFPMVTPCPLFTSTLCMCVCVKEGMCGSLLAQMLGCVCVQCVNLGLVGLLRHDPDCVGLCLQQCYPPQPWPANLTDKDLGHPPPLHQHWVCECGSHHLWEVKCATFLC